jgi:predicted transcriptional regulator of viral defense system
MKQIDALARLLGMKQAAFTTGDAAAALAVRSVAASKMLGRLAAAGHLVRLAPGRWGVPDRLEPFALPEHLTAPLPAYVSLYSAMFHHGLIEQIPSVVYAVTLGRAQRRTTPLGVVRLHHVDAAFFFGYESHGRSGIKIAVPEKALLDALYLGAGHSGGLGELPEVELPKSFRVSVARAMLRRIPSPERRRRVAARLTAVLTGAAPAAGEEVADSGFVHSTRQALAGVEVA